MKNLIDILPIISEVTGTLEDNGQSCIVCGAVRRGQTDIDFVPIAVMGSLSETLHHLIEHESLEITKSKSIFLKKICNRLDMKINDVDFKLYRTEPDYEGAMILHLTGNPNFTIAICQRAKSMCYRLNRYGLWFHGDQIAGKTEEQIFYALDLDYIEPEDRNPNNRHQLGGLLNYGFDWTSETDDETDDE